MNLTLLETLEKAKEKLDEEDYKKAVKGILRMAETREASFSATSDSLAFAFVWAKTEEGQHFWERIYDEMRISK